MWPGHEKHDYLKAYAADVCFELDAPAPQCRLGGRRTVFADAAPYDTARAAWDAQNLEGGRPPAPQALPAPPDSWLFGTTPSRNQSLSTGCRSAGCSSPWTPPSPRCMTHLPDLQYLMVRALAQSAGTWHTLLTGVVATRLEVVLTGLRRKVSGCLSFASFDGRAPPDAGGPGLGAYMRYCKYTTGGCDGNCALIDSVGSYTVSEGTLSLLQATLASAARAACGGPGAVLWHATPGGLNKRSSRPRPRFAGRRAAPARSRPISATSLPSWPPGRRSKSGSRACTAAAARAAAARAARARHLQAKCAVAAIAFTVGDANALCSATEGPKGDFWRSQVNPWSGAAWGQPARSKQARVPWGGWGQRAGGTSPSACAPGPP